MRLWSLHHRYLDPKGLVALWREALLAQAVLAGQTRGYRQHPQLIRFRMSSLPGEAISAYLWQVHAEAERRGYRFDMGRIRHRTTVETLPVTRGQLGHEWAHLREKLRLRSPGWFDLLGDVRTPVTHPLFHVIDGDVEHWEVGARRAPG